MTSLTGPRLVTSLYDVTLPNPSNWTLTNDVGEARGRTLDGTEVVDIYYRKRKYELTWDTMLDSDYNNLMQLIEHHIDRGATLTFTWGKWPQTVSGVPVIARVPQRGFRAGAGASGYYSKVSLVLNDTTNQQS